ncbi:MAG: 4Fe-4S dicluster domain-containing protein [Aquificaceae bacterium]|nr:4Fe-4S dicluster domain-containing protein [Aquificaceae bacterium]
MEGKGEGRHYVLNLEGFSELFERLKEEYRIIAPKIKDGVILYSDVESLKDLPFGIRNVEFPGFCSLERVEGFFTYTHPVNSIKSFIHPPQLKLMKVIKSEEGLKFQVSYPEDKFCFFDVRACDLSALSVLDKVFLSSNPHPDPYYWNLRREAFIVAVNCTYATHTCFCTTMGNGPEVKESYHLLITELDGEFLIEVGLEKGRELMESLKNKRYVEEGDFEKKKERIERAISFMEKAFEREGLPQKLYERMDCRHWEYLDKKCLACTSCTQVCPTCFCFDIVENNHPEFEESERVRVWDSCFSPEFATVHRYNLRQSIHSRYRQWLMHKFAYWVDQFGVFGCVGCGRCITWCPVGIDIRQEVRHLLEENP